MSPPDLRQQAVQVLRANDAGLFTKPGPHQYPHQWNWDSALVALGLAHFDLPRAQAEIRSLLSGQWRDGMLPHIVYHDRPSDYFPNAAFWQIESSPNAPSAATSGITQPPLLASVVRRLYEKKPDRDFAREVFPALLGWQRWLHTARSPGGDGLAAIIHPWESGTDDSPRWLAVLETITPRDVPEFTRGDVRYIAAAERPHQADYQRFIYLLDVFRRERYDPAALLAKSPFLVQDVLFNAILYRADRDLRWLAAEIGQPGGEIDGWMRQMLQAFDRRFWDEQRGLFLDYDLRAGRPIAVSTGAAFLPLYAGLASPRQAELLVREHLLSPQEYAPNDSVRYRLTSTSQSEPAWEARRYWRGPVWIILNWLVSEGLRDYGYHQQAEDLRRDSLALMARSGFREYYDPRDGTGCGSTDFSWSAALYLEME